MAVILTEAILRKGVRECRVCKQTKPISEFIHNPNNRWMPADCRECERKRHKILYKVKRANGWNTYREELTEKPRPNRCEACGKKTKLCFDHCHITGLFRGWLCNPCNSTLGWAKDNPERLRALAGYLERFYRSPEILRLLV